MCRTIERTSKLGYRRFKIVQKWKILGPLSKPPTAPELHFLTHSSDTPPGRSVRIPRESEWRCTRRLLLTLPFPRAQDLRRYGIAFSRSGRIRTYEWLRDRFGPFFGLAGSSCKVYGSYGSYGIKPALLAVLVDRDDFNRGSRSFECLQRVASGASPREHVIDLRSDKADRNANGQEAA